MSLYDLLRGFFGFRGERRSRDPFFGGITREDEDDEDDEDDGGPSFGPSNDFGFGFTFGPGGVRFHDNFGFDQLFQDFNSLFDEVGAWTLPPRSFEFPGIEAPPSASHSRERRQTVRDSMLKYPDSRRPDRALQDDFGPIVPERRPWHPFQGLEVKPAPADLQDTPKEDRDLDSHVTSEGLETILSPAPQPRSYFKSISVTKVVAPDGTVEERRTVRDSHGHEETVVSRQSRGEPYHGLEGGRPSESGDLVSPRGGMDDSSSILDVFFRRWFQGR
ncbi:HCLS1-associated protein X-1 [Paroedura picta]|uniref:HCLS1-associated protein X-1 n=1 Tax=Paroedura picta TaxID=143630 RepID=UPI004055F734